MNLIINCNFNQTAPYSSLKSGDIVLKFGPVLIKHSSITTKIRTFKTTTNLCIMVIYNPLLALPGKLVSKGWYIS